MSLKIALCQFHIMWENKKENYGNAVRFIEEASREKADLILFPEMSFTGFSMNIGLTAESKGETLGYMRNQAAKYKIGIGFGWVRKNETQAENHYTVIDVSGKVLCDYVKIHSFGYGGEGEQFISGNEVKTFEMNGYTIAPFICYDLRFPEIFQCVSKVAQVILLPANWPETRKAHWKCLLRARAIENQTYLLGINCVGDIGGMYYSGDSCVIAPDGEVLGYVVDQESLIYTTIESEMLKVRDAFPVKKDRKELLYSKMYNLRQ